MPDFKRILLAVDFSKESEYIGKRTIEVAEKYGAKLFLIHVVVDLSSHWYERIIMSSLSDDIEEQLIDGANKQLRELAKRLGVPDTECVVELGSPKDGILKAVKDHDIDLIALGSHGLGGVDSLLGSTSHAILHKAPVDVYVVRLPS